MVQLWLEKLDLLLLQLALTFQPCRCESKGEKLFAKDF